MDLPDRVQGGSGLHPTMPSSNPSFDSPAYAVRLDFSGPIPALGSASIPIGRARITNVATGLVLDSGGDVPSGSMLKQWNWDGSPNPQWTIATV